MSVGIYKVVNLVNKKVYVGQSKNIEKRWAAHKRAAYLVDAPSYEYPIYRAIRKYGIENFSFEIIELCPVGDLNEKEKFWISHYNSFFEGYNSTVGGGSFSTPKQNIIGIFEDLKNTSKTHSDIAFKWGVSVEMVQGINTGRYWKTDMEYPIQKTNFHTCMFDGCNKRIGSYSKYCLFHYKEVTKKERPSRDTLKRLIFTQSFLSIGRDFEVSGTTVRRWCESYKLPSTKAEISKYSELEWQEI